MTDTASSASQSPTRRALAPVMAAVGLFLGGLGIEAVLAQTDPGAALVWVQPAAESICVVALVAVAYLCLERHRTRTAPLAWWTGLVFGAAAVKNVFYILTFPGLVGAGGVIGQNPSTSAYFSTSQYVILGVGLAVAACLSRNPRLRDVARTPNQQVAQVIIALGAAAAVSTGLVLLVEGGPLPPLVTPGGFTTSQVWLNRGAALCLLTAWALLVRSTTRYRPWLSRPLLLSVALLGATLLVAEFPIQRYDGAWYALRVIRPVAFCLVLFGVLAEYTGLYRDERRRAETQASLATAAGELAALHSPGDIVRVLGQRLRLLVGGDRSVAVFLLDGKGGAFPALSEGAVAQQILAAGPRPADAGYIGQVLRTRRPYATIGDDDPLSVRVPGAPNRPGAVLAVPLMAEELLGAVIMTRYKRVAYDALELEAAMLFAHQASAALQRAHQAEAVDQMKNEFVSLVSHELRTPLTSIKGYVELLLDGEVGELADEQREFLGIVKKNVDREVALINDLLDISRMEAGRVELLWEPLDVVQLARDAGELLRPQMEAKSQSFDIEPGGDAPRVMGDHGRVSQMLSNLLSNAHKYTPAGGRITVRVRSAGPPQGVNGGDSSGAPDAPVPHWVRVEVADTGIGLSEEEQSRLFEKFFRAKNRTTEEVGGTGLGLTITRQLVELHGGTVSVKSDPGKGSTFTVLLPGERSARPLSAQHPPLIDPP